MHMPLVVVTIFMAANPESTVTKITLNQAGFDDLADALRIVRRSGTVEFSVDQPKAQLVMEFYKDGKKLPSTGWESVLVDVKAVNLREKNCIRFGLQVIDMDYLTLGDGKQGHCRLLMKLDLGSGSGTSTIDIPKAELDFSKMQGGGQFSSKASTDRQVPVLWMLGNTNSVVGGNTPEEVVKRNPKGHLAIIYIRLFK